MKNLKLLIVIFCILFISCGTSPLGCSVGFAIKFQDELADVTNAAEAYNTDPTPANCIKYRDAYLDYIDALEDWGDCAVQNNSSAEFNESLKEARDSLDELEC